MIPMVRLRYSHSGKISAKKIAKKRKASYDEVLRLERQSIIAITKLRYCTLLERS